MRPSALFLDHFDAPRNLGVLHTSSGQEGGRIGEGSARRPGGEALLRVQLLLRGDTIAVTRFKAFGCSALIAAASLASEQLTGAKAQAIELLRATMLIEALDLPKERHYCADLVREAWLTALSDARRASPKPLQVPSEAAIPAARCQR